MVTERWLKCDWNPLFPSPFSRHSATIQSPFSRLKGEISSCVPLNWLQCALLFLALTIFYHECLVYWTLGNLLLCRPSFCNFNGILPFISQHDRYYTFLHSAFKPHINGVRGLRSLKALAPSRHWNVFFFHRTLWHQRIVIRFTVTMNFYLDNFKVTGG